MAETDVTLPSGAIVRVRGLKGKELRLMSNKVAVANGRAITDVLTACTVEVLDAGIYASKGFGWKAALDGDRVAAILGMWCAMYPGEKYAFDVRCRDGNCKAVIAWEVDLKELPHKALPEASAEKIRGGDVRFETSVAGKRFGFRLLTGSDGERIISLGKLYAQTRDDAVANDVRMILSLAAKTVDVDGAKLKDEDLLDLYDDMDIPDLLELVQAFDAPGCGVETGIEIQCPSCELVQEVDLPFGAALFTRRRRAVTKSSRS